MKNTLSLLALVLLLSSCYDNFRLGGDELEPPIVEPTGVTTTTDDGSDTDADNDTDDDSSNDNETVTDLASIIFTDVVQDESGQTLAGVEVAMYAAGKRYADFTNEAGEYRLEVPAADLPQLGFISMSLVKQGYIPYNSCYKAPLQAGTVYGNDVDGLALSPCADCLVLGEKSSDLFHLGDDNYGGPENSQFQKMTDGTEVIIPIQQPVDTEQIRITFQVKGIQPKDFELLSNVQFLSGGEVVSTQYIEENSALDGSFSTYSMTVRSASTITAFRFATDNQGYEDSDYDDWEFTCLYAEAQ